MFPLKTKAPMRLAALDSDLCLKPGQGYPGNRRPPFEDGPFRLENGFESGVFCRFRCAPVEICVPFGLESERIFSCGTAKDLHEKEGNRDYRNNVYRHGHTAKSGSATGSPVQSHSYGSDHIMEGWIFSAPVQRSSPGAIHIGSYSTLQ